MDCNTLVFFVNGRKIEESCADPAMTLLQYLRLKLKLTGTKLGCAEGGCGACTVMVSKYNRINSKIMHFSVNACLAPICSMHGLAVTTVEGIGSTKTGLHPVQERLARSHGSQCGFCTPGIVMSMYSLLRNNPQPSRSELESAFEGNLCRCTGYRPILDGFNTFTKEYQCGLGEKCCKFQKQSDSDEMSAALFDASEFTQYDPTQEPIFPSELQLDAKYDEQSLVFKTDRFTWYRPTTLSEVLDLKATFPHARLIVGNTEVGVEVKFKNQYYPVLVDVSHIPELTDIEHTEAGVRFGVSCTLSHMEHELASAVEREPEHKTRVFRAILEMLRWFAGHQIRNVASVAGNIMTASPISDLNPLFLAAGCKLIVIAKGTASKSITMDENFFKGYRKTALKPEDVLVSILIPFTEKNEFFAGYKQAHRRDDDIAIVNAGMKITLDESSLIQNAAFAFGGMAPFTVMALKTMKGVIGRAWSENLVDEVCKLLESDLPLPPGTPGGMEPYRRTLTTSFFFKFFLHVQQEINSEKIPTTYNSATTQYKREASKGVQLYEEVAPGQLDEDPVGRPLKHVSAEKQVTGEAIYCDDIPNYEGELYLALVLSTKAHAKILSVDTSAAVAIPGVHCYIDHNDIPACGTNFTRVTALKDEEVFATEKVTCQGNVIGAIVADNQATAQRAAKLVRVEYEELRPILTIEEAVAADSFFTEAQELADGDVDVGLQQAAHVIEGEVRIGGQEHFYLETQTTIGVPKGEDGEIEVFCSCQSPTTAQMLVASVLGVPANRVVVRVKRMGGGFGGKETRFNTLLLPVVVAAHKLGRPVRCMLDRDEDMILTGTRHPFLARYKAGCNVDGKLTAVEMQLYNNGGNTLDLSDAVMGKALLSLNNAYSIPNVKVVGRTCKTNIPSNTAFRGFGGPQAMFVMETIMTQLAAKLNTDVTELREINFVQEGDRLYYNMIVKNCTMQRCWNQVIESGQLNHRKKEIVEFNNQNRWKKRGIAIVPTKFGIAFTQPVLNQTGALVHIYTDGSVLLTHGGTEMGQGLHTKMLQVASRALRIDINKIHFSETSTATVPNTSPTAASVGSDLNGMAVLEACKKLLKRLDPYIQENPKGKWEDWVSAAYVDRVSLSATGFYKIPDVGFNMKKKEGRAFNYFSFGAGISEVEVDCLTGDHTVLRTDIVMDVGTSLNPAIDIGQIEGGFVQGYGLFTLEEQRYSPDGFLYTRGPGMYKIPGFTDIPVEFNVSILKGASNPQAVYSSKAIGEPPLFIASSVFFAIYDAVSAARKEEGLIGHFRFDSPATAEKIRMACVDKFTKQFPEANPGTYKPWFVYL